MSVNPLAIFANKPVISNALLVEGSFTDLSSTNLLGFAYLGIVGTGLAYTLWFRGIDKLSASAVSYLGLMSPVVATLIGFIFLNQTLTSIQLVGVAIVLLSVLVGQQIKRSRRRSAIIAKARHRKY